MSIIFLIILLFFALLSIFLKHIKFCKIILLLTLSYVLAIGSGLVPYLLSKTLQAAYVDLPTAQWGENNAIILLGGGSIKLPNLNRYIPSTMIYSRIYKAAELYFLCKPQHLCKIIISGGSAKINEKPDALIYKAALLRLGVSDNDFILEKNSTDTQTNAEFTSAIIKKFNFNQVILVTSGIHLKRSLLWFNHFGIQAKPALADYQAPYFSIMSLGNNFALTDFSLHEYLGIVEIYLKTYWN